MQTQRLPVLSIYLFIKPSPSYQKVLTDTYPPINIKSSAKFLKVLSSPGRSSLSQKSSCLNFRRQGRWNNWNIPCTYSHSLLICAQQICPSVFFENMFHHFPWNTYTDLAYPVVMRQMSPYQKVSPKKSSFKKRPSSSGYSKKSVYKICDIYVLGQVQLDNNWSKIKRKSFFNLCVILTWLLVNLSQVNRSKTQTGPELGQYFSSTQKLNQL